MSIDFNKDLNEQQRKAVTSSARHLRIIAGAGTGKTRVLTYRLAYLIAERHISPRSIVAITFTNKVAKEMKDRVSTLVGNEVQNWGSPLITTFHGFCYRFLIREIGEMPDYAAKFQIADEETQAVIFKEFADRLGFKMKSPYMSELIGTIRNLKTRGVFPDEISSADVPFGATFTYQALESVYTGYQERLKKSNLLDFDDLLMFTLRILKRNSRVRKMWQHRFNVFLVDEFQDTNNVQYEIVKQFMDENTELAVVGDPDQTIYTWRGADNDIVRYQLEKDFADLETITLAANYRSTQAILDMANKLIKNNSDRIDKNLVAANEIKGDEVEFFRAFSQDDEAKRIATAIFNSHRKGRPYSDFAIIYRSNFLSRALEQSLSQAGIPYRLYGTLKFYERAEVKDALSYFRLLVNPDDSYSFARILKAPPKGIAEKGAGELALLTATYGVNLIDALKDHLDEAKLSRKAAENLRNFIKAYQKCLNCLENVDDLKSISKILHDYLDDCGFLDYVRELDRKKAEKDDDIHSSSKFDNVIELLAYVDSFMLNPGLEEGLEPTLEDFLILVAIQSAQDEIDNNAAAVSVMTAHISKGLEFPLVFVTGLSQNVFPSSHAISAGTRIALEEERRLLYVAMTRAREHLTLSCFGGFNYMQGGDYVPSVFLKELGLLERGVNIRSGISDRTPNKKAADEYHRIQAILEPRYQKDESEYQGRRGIVQEEKTKDAYSPGDRLVHSSFGIGEVTAVNGDRLTVIFPQHGTKILMNGFKAFKKLNNK